MLLIDRDLLLQVQEPPSQTCESRSLSVSNVQSLVLAPWHTRGCMRCPSSFLQCPCSCTLLRGTPSSWTPTGGSLAYSNTTVLELNPKTLRFVALDQSMEILTLLSKEMGKPDWLVGNGQCPDKSNGRFDWQNCFHEDVTQKCSGLVHWEDPEGWDGEGGGRGDQDGDSIFISCILQTNKHKNHTDFFPLQALS